jgi:hypothetical protein
LGNVGDHLVPGGCLVFDVFLGLMKDPHSLRPAWRGSTIARSVAS